VCGFTPRWTLRNRLESGQALSSGEIKLLMHLIRWHNSGNSRVDASMAQAEDESPHRDGPPQDSTAVVPEASTGSEAPNAGPAATPPPGLGDRAVPEHADSPVNIAFAPTLSSNQLIAERYQVTRFIGRGGMGEVYEAEDLYLHEHVALKIIRPEIATSAQTIARFKRETQLARKVTHPNVCRIFDVAYCARVSPRGPGEAQHEITFLSMELLKGETLARRLRRTGCLTTAEALPIVGQIASGLEAAHKAGVIHRDFKSANIMLVPVPGEGIRAVVMDFGLARSAVDDDAASADYGRSQSMVVGEVSSGPITGSDTVLGTPDYIAPEQLERKQITAAADIYALGVVTYEMVTGTLPFVGESRLSTAMKRLSEPPPSPRMVVPQLGPRWEMAILRCLRREPTERFRNVADVVKALGGDSKAVQLDLQTNALELVRQAQIRQAQKVNRARDAVSDAVHNGRFEQAIKLAEKGVQESPHDRVLRDLLQVAKESKLRLDETLDGARQLLQAGDPRAATALLDAAPEFVSNNDDFRKLSAECREALDRAGSAKKLRRRKNVANAVFLAGFAANAYCVISLWRPYLEASSLSTFLVRATASHWYVYHQPNPPLSLLTFLFSAASAAAGLGCGITARYLISRNVTLILGNRSKLVLIAIATVILLLAGLAWQR